MAAGMRLDVYSTDAEVYEASAARAAEWLNCLAADRRVTVTLSGGPCGQGVMTALAAHDDLRWDRIDWFWGDERSVRLDDPRSNVRLARMVLLGPRRVAPAAIHPPPVELEDPARVAEAYAETLAAHLECRPAPIVDLVLLGVGTNGHIASLMPGSAALTSTVWVAPVSEAEVSDDPRVARITITPPVLRAARQIIVTVVGAAKAQAVAAAMEGPLDPQRVPAHLVHPSETVTWIVDRAAAANLLRDARPAAPTSAES